MEKLLSYVSKINNHLLECSSIDDALNFCIRDIGLEHDLDRCYILKNINNSNLVGFDYAYACAYEWCNNGIEPYISHFGACRSLNTIFSALDSFLSREKSRFGTGKDIDNKLLKKVLEVRDVKSFFFVPIFSDNVFWGWLGLEDCKNERIWSEKEIYVIQTITKSLGLRVSQTATISKLERTIEKFNYFMSSSNQAMWEFDIETGKTNFSLNWFGILGYTSEEIKENPDFWRTIFSAKDWEAILDEFTAFVAGRIDRFEGNIKIIHKDGHSIPAKYSGLLKYNSYGIPKKVIGTYMDISELVEKEKQLVLSEAKFRFIAENTTDLICQYSKDGSLVYLSSLAQEIIGYNPEELIGKCPWDFIHKRDLNSIKQYHQSLVSTHQSETITFRFQKKDGNYVWLEASTKVMLDSEKNIVGFQTSSRDITKRIKADKEMKAAFLKERKFNELKSRFVSIASHQFRTPLTVIYSNAELLELKTDHSEKKLSDDCKIIVSRIKNEVERMTELMNNILVFGKQEAKKIEKVIQPIDFNEFIQTLTKTYFNDDNGTEIKVIKNGVKRTFFTDESLIVHILTNVISNAFKYSAGRPDPELIINYLDHNIEIQVVDYGLGIPKKDLPNLFTSFFRASNTNSIIGSGLGLVIVKQFTEFLNGTVELKTKENFGTTVKLTFPYEQN
jgi:PAS domain S-box-containing protein